MKWLAVLVGIALITAAVSQGQKQYEQLTVVRNALENVRKWDTFTTSSTVFTSNNCTNGRFLRTTRSKVRFNKVDDVHHELYASVSYEITYSFYGEEKKKAFDIEIVQGQDVWVNVLNAPEEYVSGFFGMYQTWARLADLELYGRVPEGQEFLDTMGFGIKNSEEVRGLVGVKELPQQVVGGSKSRIIEAQANCADSQQPQYTQLGMAGDLGSIFSGFRDTNVGSNEGCPTFAFTLTDTEQLLQITSTIDFYSNPNDNGECHTQDTVSRIYSQVNEPVAFPVQPTPYPAPAQPSLPTHQFAWFNFNTSILALVVGAILLALIIFGVIFAVIIVRKKLKSKAEKPETEQLLPEGSES